MFGMMKAGKTRSPLIVEVSVPKDEFFNLFKRDLKSKGFQSFGTTADIPAKWIKGAIVTRDKEEIRLFSQSEGTDVFYCVVLVTEALENVKPQMEVKARRIGGAAYQVPSPVRGVRRD